MSSCRVHQNFSNAHGFRLNQKVALRHNVRTIRFLVACVLSKFFLLGGFLVSSILIRITVASTDYVKFIVATEASYVSCFNITRTLQHMRNRFSLSLCTRASTLVSCTSSAHLLCGTNGYCRPSTSVTRTSAACVSSGDRYPLHPDEAAAHLCVD